VSAPTYDLGKLHGGLRLPAHKSESTAEPIRELPIPAQLVLPIEQHVDEPAQPVVGVGDRVLKGQRVAEPEGEMGAPVHASASGTFIAIKRWPVSRRHGDKAPCIIIECDGKDEAIADTQVEDYRPLAPADLLLRILDGGIVGLGGAVFPTAQKLMQARTCETEYLILNGVECEPYISCDDVLMRERAPAVLNGAQTLMHALQIDTCYVAVESDKPAAIARLGEALAELDDDRIVLKQVPTVHPSGGEDQLGQLVTNREVPSACLPTALCCLGKNGWTDGVSTVRVLQTESLVSFST